MKLNILAKVILGTAILMLLLCSSTLTSFSEISFEQVPLQGDGNGKLTLPEHEWVDGTHAKPLWEEQESAPAQADLAAHSGGGGPSPPPLDFTSDVGDWGTGVRYTQNFHWVMTGEHCYMYVAYDLTPPYENYYDAVADEYVFENPYYPVGGYTPEDRISTAQLAYLMNEFDNTIYPTMTSTFGFPDERPVGETKIYILIMNIRDPSYYDATVTWYVGGYFSYGEDVIADKNMIHIDSYDWANRIGPGVDRPYGYEITFAHEFEHLIHQDIDADEESWVDEGCADIAGYFCGYGHSRGHIAYYLIYHPWTALTFWGGALEDYGASYLFILYLYDHFGGEDFVVDLVLNPLNSIEGVEDTLADWGYTIGFDEVFYNWAIANYIDDTSIGDGEYGYFSLDIPSIDTWGYSIEYALQNMWHGTEFWRGFGYYAHWWPGLVKPYTANYWRWGFVPAGFEANFLYMGDPTSGMPAYSGSYHWYGGMGHWVWRQLYQTFPVPMGGATLNFYTYYEIETDWDYFYVEVHDIDADTWTTLSGKHTTTTLPNPQDNPNCDDPREPEAYSLAGEWNALTGFSSDFEDPAYYQEEMDLTPFADHDIELYFVYWTDGAYNELGVYIDDISIPEIGFFDDAEAGEDGWTNIDWTLGTGLYPNEWQGAVIDITGVIAYRNPSGRYNMRTGKMINFKPGMLHNVWSLSSGSLTIPPEYVNEGHVFVAVLYNAAPHIVGGDYLIYAY